MDPKLLIEDFAIRYGLQVIGAIVILIAGVLVARWLGSMADRRLRKGRMEPPMRILLVRILRIGIIVVAIVAVLDKLGVQITPLIAGIGVAGIGVGFALQGVLSNIVAGLTIILTKPFRVGEYIKVAGVEGAVHTIDLPSTVLLHADHSRVIVPNRKIVGEILHNFGVIRQIKVDVAVANPADVGNALTTIRESHRAHAARAEGPGALVRGERGGRGRHPHHRGSVGGRRRLRPGGAGALPDDHRGVPRPGDRHGRASRAARGERRGDRASRDRPEVVASRRP